MRPIYILFTLSILATSCDNSETKHQQTSPDKVYTDYIISAKTLQPNLENGEPWQSRLRQNNCLRLCG